MKIFVVIAVLLCSASCFSITTDSSLTLSDKQILQLDLNGLFEQNKMPDPTTIMNCIDDKTAHDMVLFLTDSLAKAAKGSISDLISLVSELNKFAENLDPKVQACLGDNKQLQAWELKYGITPDTEASTIEKKVIAYATLHYFTVHNWFVSLNSLWLGGKYYQVGFDTAGYMHTMLDMSEIQH